MDSGPVTGAVARQRIVTPQSKQNQRRRRELALFIAVSIRHECQDHSKLKGLILGSNLQRSFFNRKAADCYSVALGTV
jgi:hypothetical protein